MKKQILFGTALMAVLALVGCKKEQSEVTLDDMAGVAKVQGKVTYDAGYQVANGAVVEEPAAVKEGVEVVLEISYSEYDASAEGKQQYTTTTDANGMYYFAIPVGKKAINATVEVLPFEAAYGDLVDGYDANAVVSIQNAIFNTSTTESVSLENAKTRTADLHVTTTSEFDYASFKGGKTIKIKGDVYVQSEEWIDPDNKSATKVNQALQAKAPKGVKVAIFVWNSSVLDAPMFVYIKETEASDNTTKSYEWELPICDAWNLEDGNVRVELDMMDFYVAPNDELNGYKHLYWDIDAAAGKTQYLGGIWSLSGSVTGVPTAINKEQALVMPAMTLKFKPNEDAQEPVYGINKLKKGDVANYVSNNIYSWTLSSLD